jgi:hypothetical protein
LGDREALNIEELKNDEVFAASVATSSEENPSVSFFFPGLEDFLAQEYPGLFGESLQPTAGYS